MRLPFVRRVGAASAVLAALAQFTISAVASTPRHVGGKSSALRRRPPNHSLSRTPNSGPVAFILRCVFVAHAVLALLWSG